MQNILIYDVEFPDGQIKKYAANIIAENMYAQVDADGHIHTLLDSIVNYAKDERLLIALICTFTQRVWVEAFNKVEGWQ